jgi:SAM-dependent methyltransferase
VTLFGTVYAGAYDALYGEKDYPGECDMIEALLAEFGGGAKLHRLIDFGCGTGNHAIALANRGFEVVGVDRSAAMLAHAETKAAAAGARSASFVLSDIADLRLGGAPFDAAIMMFAVLGYQQSDEEVRAALATARAHLPPNGLLILDIWYGPAVESQKPGPRERVIDSPDGRILRRSTGTVDEARKLCTVGFVLERWRHGVLTERSEEDHLMRYFFAEDLEQLGRACGLELLVLRDLADPKNPAHEGSWNAAGVFRAV